VIAENIYSVCPAVLPDASHGNRLLNLFIRFLTPVGTVGRFGSLMPVPVVIIVAYQSSVIRHRPKYVFTLVTGILPI